MKFAANFIMRTPHAAERAVERKISIAEISEVIISPDAMKTQGPKYILVKQLDQRKDNKIACVLLEKKKYGMWVVITVMHNFKESENGT